MELKMIIAPNVAASGSTAAISTKYIERNSQQFDQYKGSRHDDDDDDRDRREHKHPGRDRPYGDQGGYRKPQKKSMWGELFDFD